MRFATVRLAMNISGLRGEKEDCNPGGSTICTHGTEGCDAGLTCVGTSSKAECAAGSGDPFERGLEAELTLSEHELSGLQKELEKVLRTASERSAKAT